MVRAKAAPTDVTSRRSTRSAAKADTTTSSESASKAASRAISRRKAKDETGACVERASAKNQSSVVSKTPARANLQSGRTQKSLKHLPPVASLVVPTKGVRFTSDAVDEEEDFDQPVTALRLKARATPGRSAKNQVNYKSRRDSCDSLESKDGENSDFEVHSDVCTESESESGEESPLATPSRPRFRKPLQIKTSTQSVSSKSDKALLSALEDFSIKDVTRDQPKTSPRKEPPRQKSSTSKSTSTTTSRRGSVSSVDFNIAVVRFSPPPSKPVYSLSPPKETLPLEPPERSTTPPLSPSKSKLTSPRKLLNRIPPTPGHRQSMDAFWNFNDVNDWNEQHSPRKTLKLQSPRKFHMSTESASESSSEPPSPIISPTKRNIPESPSKRVLAAAKKAFDARKIGVADDLLAELDHRITSNRISELTASTGGVKLIWSNKLNTTAGRANWRREAVHTHKNGQTTTTHRHVASIELASKVIDDEARLLNVVAHEFCHLANFMVSNVRTEPHGRSFQEWARKVSTAFADRGVTVTTKHDYQIAYKYAWECVDCGCEYQRHSKSIDVSRQRCGRCKARLVQTRPPPRKNADAQAADGTVKKGAYAEFVKDNFKAVQLDLGSNSPMKDVMREVGVRYRAQKAASQTSPMKKTSPEKREGQTSPEKTARKVDVEVVDMTADTSDEAASDGEEETESEDTGVLDVARKLDFLSVKAVTSSSQSF